MRYDNPELRRRLAAEYALGTLRGAARRRFERLLVRDADLQAQVAHWEERLADMAWATTPSPSVPDRVWASVSRRIDNPAPWRRPGLWNSLAFWRGVGFAATAMVLALIVLPLAPPDPSPTPMPERVAMIAEPGQDAMGWIVTAEGGGQLIRARAIVPPQMPEGEVCVLWLEWPDGVVRPVGVLPEEGELSLPVPVTDRAPYQARVSVTIERAADLPMEAPSGRNVFRGPWLEL
ncbi:hypothetical protein B1C78_09620 [Thioalkalivibrio denitrificans]|uniref:Anti-sigma K factor RskA C-terminal domain-containing protein n=1 Tax=Thioalkalivibrio denitrificans TaxID=108003 RepID=A0A1V3NGS7_9GAMM|nr:anti-sigma factor [Thioalkalivibrio denitrificans]OOG23986.1 hypothetical protein B1C78_09620 [Thioalkalivibrio denitrificans]